MAIRISTAAAIAGCDAIVDYIDEGVGDAGTLVVYSGTRPATVDTPVDSQVALVTFELANPAFGNAVDAANSGHATANAVAPVQADATGTATWFRIYNADDNPVYDGTATDTGGAGDAKLSSTAIIEGIDVTIVSLTAALPKGA